MPPKARPGYSLRPHGTTPGRWRVKVSVGRDPLTGAQRQRSKVIEARTVTQARRIAAQWAAEVRPAPPDSLTFGDVLDRFMDEHVIPERDPSTARGYASKIKLWIRPGLGDKKATALNRPTLAAWRRELGKIDRAPRTKNQIIAIVKSAIYWADRQGYPVDAGAARAVLKLFPVDTPDVEPPPLRDVLAVIAEAMAVDEEFGLMLWLTAVTGARRGELAGYRWEDYDGETITTRRSIDQSGLVKSTKTKRQRPIPLDPGTCALLEEHRRQQMARLRDHERMDVAVREGWMFPSPLDWTKPRNPDSLSHRLADLRGDNDVWLHGLRHGVATILVAAGVDIGVVSARLGHSRKSTTMDIYVAPVGEQERRAAQIIADQLRALMVDHRAERGGLTGP